jgi:hypothetical protein
MLYLKNTLGGLGRTLTESAMQTLHAPRRWWKLALYVVLFILPGGSIGVVFFAWLERRRAQQAARNAASAAAACQSRLEAPASACRAAASKAAIRQGSLPKSAP